MGSFGRCRTVVAAVCIVIGFAGARADDTQEITNYALSAAGLSKYAQATKNLAALPDGCADDDSDAETDSITAMVARIDSVPGATAAVKSAGLSTHEYVVFSMSLLQNGVAAWALTQPGGTLPPGTSKANVDFVNQHGAEIKQLQSLAHRCEEADDIDEE